MTNVKTIAFGLVCLILGASLTLNFVHYRAAHSTPVGSPTKEEAVAPDFGAPPTEACKRTIEEYFLNNTSDKRVFEFGEASKASIDDPDKPGSKVYGWRFEAKWNFKQPSQSNFPMAGQFLARGDSILFYGPTFGDFGKWPPDKKN
ncbi:MAG: hypothetical protein WBW41_10385 [Verrucomicrobiia bacterium]